MRGRLVKDGIFGNNRSRGILIKASDGEITGNTLINTHMAGILIAPEYYWLESGFSHDLTIANNRILHPRREAILIRGVGPFPGHHNIRITHNLVLSNFSPALHLKAVQSGRIADNHFLTPNGDPLPNPLRTEFCFDIDLH